MDAQQVSAARMLSLGLVPTEGTSPAEVVRSLGCMQAQALGGALVSIALRSGHGSLDEVRAAFDRGQIVRTWTQRGTIHFAPAEDVGWILGLTAERIMRSDARRRDHFGVDEAMLESAAEIADTSITERGPLTRDELLEALQPITAGGREGEEYGRQRYLLTTLSMRGIIVQGPLVEGKDEQRFALSSTWISAPVRLDHDEALCEWLRRYVLSHGPVTLDDAARWTGLPKGQCRAAIETGVDQGDIVRTTIREREYFHAPDLDDRLAEHGEAARGLFLLPGFDELILGYKDRSFTLDPMHEKAVVPGGNGMFKNTLIQDATVRATWKRSPRKSGPPILVEPLDGGVVDVGLAEETARRHPAFVRV